MAKYDKMIKIKKEQVNKKIEIINVICNNLIMKNEKISCRRISELSEIPQKTLENKNYKNIIKSWIESQKEEDNESKDNIYLDEIKHLKNIISQLRKQNDNLKYQLYKNTEF